MLIAGKKNLIDVTKIVSARIAPYTTYKDPIDDTLIIETEGTTIVISPTSPDYETFKTLLFSGGIPDKIVSADTVIAQMPLITELTKLNTRAAEQSLRLRIIEDTDSVAERDSLLTDIETLGMKGYRDKHRAEYAAQSKFQGLIKQ